MMKFNLDAGGDGALFHSILPLPYSTRFFEKYKACLSRRTVEIIALLALRHYLFRTRLHSPAADIHNYKRYYKRPS